MKKKTPLKITFVTPGMVWTPGGSYRVVYEYANQLVSLGHQVTIVHPLKAVKVPNSYQSLGRTVKEGLQFVRKFVKSARPKWFDLLPDVQVIKTTSLRIAAIRYSDILVATNWSAAVPLYQEALRVGIPMVQFVHHYEVLGGYPEDAVHQALALPVPKVAVSRWTQKCLIDKGFNQVFYIPNGIDHRRFRIIKPIEKRSMVVCFNYVPKKIKDPKTGIEALVQAKQRFPELKVILYGPVVKPPYLPFAFKYYSRVSDEILVKDIYNESAIFLSSSRIEGFSLPAAEAMACGCAVVATDSGGIRDFAIHNDTALLSPPGDADTLASHLIEALYNKDLRIRLASSATARIKTFRWEESAKQLEVLLYQCLNDHT